MREFDLIVIGSGSGLDVAVACAQRGLRTAIVEKGPMGGTCLNRGCIPSKIIIHSADVAETIRSSKRFGIESEITRINFPAITSRASRIVDGDAKSIEASYKGIENPRLYKGVAKFVGMKTLKIGMETIRGDKIVLAHGARPSKPPIEGLEKVSYMTSNEALRLKRQPKILTIVGGGYIAAELAHFYGALGTRVQIVQRNVRLIPDEDEEVGETFTKIAKTKWDVYLEQTAEKIWKKGKTYYLRIRPKTGGAARVLRSDALLVATGVSPNSDLLDLGKTGVTVNKYGFVESDANMETNIPGIFTLGDAAGKFLFKHSANHEASYVIHNILNPSKMKAVDYTAMPHAIFSSPQVAGVGATEQTLKEKGNKYRVAKYAYKNTAMGTALQEEEGFVKFLVDEKDKVLGCHIIGPEASILIHEVLVAMKSAGGTLSDISNTVHIHPALSEVVQRAAFSELWLRNTSNSV